MRERSRDPISPVDLDWPVVARGQIAPLLLRLNRLIHAREGQSTYPQDTLALLLVGVGFSLWRAAFLAQADRAPEAMMKEATTFLGVLLRDNAIAFAQDRDNRAWTAGYYLNNAYFRLSFLNDMFRKDFPNPDVEARIGAACSTWLGGQEHYDKPNTLQRCWDDALMATEAALSHLEAQYRRRGQ